MALSNQMKSQMVVSPTSMGMGGGMGGSMGGGGMGGGSMPGMGGGMGMGGGGMGGGVGGGYNGALSGSAGMGGYGMNDLMSSLPMSGGNGMGSGMGGGMGGGMGSGMGSGNVPSDTPMFKLGQPFNNNNGVGSMSLLAGRNQSMAWGNEWKYCYIVIPRYMLSIAPHIPSLSLYFFYTNISSLIPTHPLLYQHTLSYSMALYIPSHHHLCCHAL